MTTLSTLRWCPFTPRNKRFHPLTRWIAATAIILLCACQEASQPEPEATAIKSDPKNTSYILENESITLVDGMAEAPAAPDSSSKIITRIWGEPTVADLNQDGIDDAVLILTHSTGGTGTFYYLAAAIGSPDGYTGTAGLLLGDRIEPLSIEVTEGKASVRYLIRKAEESFADKPSVEKIRDVIYSSESKQLVEVAHDFEGEADPNVMTLEMKTWIWEKTVYNNDTQKEPTKKEAFTLTFKDGMVHGTTDCNTFRGGFTVDEKRKIQFDDQMAMTRMFCEGSQEQEFMEMLQNVNSYFFTGRGQLIMELKYDSGTVQFR